MIGGAQREPHGQKMRVTVSLIFLVLTSAMVFRCEDVCFQVLLCHIPQPRRSASGETRSGARQVLVRPPHVAVLGDSVQHHRQAFQTDRRLVHPGILHRRPQALQMHSSRLHILACIGISQGRLKTGFPVVSTQHHSLIISQKQTLESSEVQEAKSCLEMMRLNINRNLCYVSLHPIVERPTS